MNKLDVRVPDSSVRCVRDLRGHFGPGCAGLIGFLRHFSVRTVRGLSQWLAWGRLVGRRAWARAGTIVTTGIVVTLLVPRCRFFGRCGR